MIKETNNLIKEFNNTKSSVKAERKPSRASDATSKTCSKTGRSAPITSWRSNLDRAAMARSLRPFNFLLVNVLPSRRWTTSSMMKRTARESFEKSLS